MSLWNDVASENKWKPGGILPKKIPQLSKKKFVALRRDIYKPMLNLQVQTFEAKWPPMITSSGSCLHREEADYLLRFIDTEEELGPDLVGCFN